LVSPWLSWLVHRDSFSTPHHLETSMKKLLLASSALFLAAGSAFAAPDLTPITTAQADSLAVVAALTTMGIAVWGANYIRRKFFN
jgi:hypothetical protein